MLPETTPKQNLSVEWFLVTNKLQFLFIPIFYLVLFYITLKTKNIFFDSNIKENGLIWTAKLFPFILKNDSYRFLFFTLTLTSLIVNVFFSRKVFRFLSAFLVITYFSFCFSIGKISHSYHPWLFSVIILIFYNSKLPLEDIKNNFIIKLTQAICLLSYFNSGVWKLRNLAQSKDSITDTALRPIGFAVGEGQPLNFVMEKIVQYPTLIAIGFISILLFQLSTIIPIIFNKYKIPYGIMIIIFHLTTGFSLGISFKSTSYCIFIFFIIAELMRTETQNSITE